MSLRVAVNPDLLAWALERSGLSAAALRDDFPEMDAWLNGSRQPRLKELEAFAKVVNAPFGALFLPAVPENWPAPGETHDTDSAVVEIDDQGGVVVPMALWDALGVAEGDSVRVWLDGNALRVTPGNDGNSQKPERLTGQRRS